MLQGQRKDRRLDGHVVRVTLSSLGELRKLREHLEQYQVMAREFEQLAAAGTENPASPR